MPSLSIRSLFATFAIVFTLTASGFSALAGDDHDIDLRLFGENVIEGYDGCHLAFWQANKDPFRDTYAYVFYAPYNDGEELPAWMKIGKEVLELSRRDSVAAEGPNFEPLRLYRDSDDRLTVVVEVIEQSNLGLDLTIEKARLIITQRDHFPFFISVKGGIFCNREGGADDASAQSDALNLPGDAISLSGGIEFSSLGEVPRGVRNTINRDAPDCDPVNTAGFGARYAVSDAMTLWEVPCNLYARNGSHVFVTALNDNPDYSNVLLFPEVPDHGDRYDFYELLNTRVDPNTAIVTSEVYEGDGSCGSYERYQLRAVEGEALEFFLLEYREKPTCDGVQGDARTFPRVYPRQ